MVTLENLSDVDRGAAALLARLAARPIVRVGVPPESAAAPYAARLERERPWLGPALDGQRAAAAEALRSSAVDVFEGRAPALARSFSRVVAACAAAAPSRSGRLRSSVGAWVEGAL